MLHALCARCTKQTYLIPWQLYECTLCWRKEENKYTYIGQLTSARCLHKMRGNGANFSSALVCFKPRKRTVPLYLRGAVKAHNGKDNEFFLTMLLCFRACLLCFGLSHTHTHVRSAAAQTPLGPSRMVSLCGSLGGCRLSHFILLRAAPPRTDEVCRAGSCAEQSSVTAPRSRQGGAAHGCFPSGICGANKFIL